MLRLFHFRPFDMIRRGLLACVVLLSVGRVTPSVAQLAAAEPEW
jgi:hypothetical protein